MEAKHMGWDQFFVETKQEMEEGEIIGIIQESTCQELQILKELGRNSGFKWRNPERCNCRYENGIVFTKTSIKKGQSLLVCGNEGIHLEQDATWRFVIEEEKQKNCEIQRTMPKIDAIFQVPVVDEESSQGLELPQVRYLDHQSGGKEEDERKSRLKEENCPPG